MRTFEARLTYLSNACFVPSISPKGENLHTDQIYSSDYGEQALLRNGEKNPLTVKRILYCYEWLCSYQINLA